jgi:hypothetical protein
MSETVATISAIGFGIVIAIALVAVIKQSVKINRKKK